MCACVCVCLCVVPPRTKHAASKTAFLYGSEPGACISRNPGKIHSFFAQSVFPQYTLHTWYHVFPSLLRSFLHITPHKFTSFSEFAGESWPRQTRRPGRRQQQRRWLAPFHKRHLKKMKKLPVCVVSTKEKLFDSTTVASSLPVFVYSFFLTFSHKFSNKQQKTVRVLGVMLCTLLKVTIVRL